MRGSAEVILEMEDPRPIYEALLPETEDHLPKSRVCLELGEKALTSEDSGGRCRVPQGCLKHLDQIGQDCHGNGSNRDGERMSGELPPQVQNQLAQLQQLQQQAQAVMAQKSQIEGLNRETDAAIKELEKTPDDAVIYKSVGEILIKAEKAKLVEELKERKDMMDLRLKTMAKQEERIQSRFTQLQEQIRNSLGQQPPRGG